MAETLHSRVVRRACELVGGHEALAERLGVSPGMVRVWLAGNVVPVPRLFFRMVDIVQDADPTYRLPPDDGSDDPPRNAAPRKS